MIQIRAFCSPSPLGGGDPDNEYTLVDMRSIGPIQAKLRTQSMLGFRCLEMRKLGRGYTWHVRDHVVHLVMLYKVWS